MRDYLVCVLFVTLVITLLFGLIFLMANFIFIGIVNVFTDTSRHSELIIFLLSIPIAFPLFKRGTWLVLDKLEEWLEVEING